MSWLFLATAAQSGPPDFSATIAFGHTAFGFVAFRHETYLLAGLEGTWVRVPSWLFGIGILALALLEWAVFKWVSRVLWRLWARRRGATPAE